MIALEDFKVQPGDLVSLYATARGARAKADTDMFFIQAEPFERNYSQSQQEGGGGGGGGRARTSQNKISQRQKEIITATWNQLKGIGVRESGAPRTRRSWRRCSRSCATRRNRWRSA